MTRRDLVNRIDDKQNLLCVGLDTDIKRVPTFLQENFDDPIFEFNRRIIEATQSHCVAYKFNIAFYESLGSKGWLSLEKSLSLIPPTHFSIADAKRGDIGNTSGLYARTFFETYNFDAITVAPYMGRDSLEPFYSYHDKWVIILGLTSNPGSADFQQLKLNSGEEVFKQVIKTASTYGDAKNTMFVVGATKSSYFKQIRDIIPDHFLLVPGIGKQGGNLEETLDLGLNEDYGMLINSSRGIIYAGTGEDFDVVAGIAAESVADDMKMALQRR